MQLTNLTAILNDRIRAAPFQISKQVAKKAINYPSHSEQTSNK
jgi:hypothetical protein